MIEIEIKTVKLSEIKLNPDNPRRISNKDMDRLVKSLTEFPDMMQIREIVVDDTLTVLGGNMRLLALRKIGAKDCTAKIVSGLTPEQKREFVIKDNGFYGTWDMDALANSWGDLPLADWGVPLSEDWLTTPTGDPADAEPQIDRAEELNKIWKVKAGDLWQIGEHRLLCGDSTKVEGVARVMGGEKADMSFCDPPYAVGISTTGIKSSLFDLKILLPFFKCWIDGLKSFLHEGAHWYISTDWRTYPIVFEVVAPLGICNVIVWDYDWIKAGGQYRFRYELMMFGFIGKTKKKVPRDEPDVWTIQAVNFTTERLHPAQKPVALIERAVKNSSEEGGTLLDLFCASGTTMVACQNLNRKCRGIEISPDYCAVILQRMTDAFPGIEIRRENG